MCSFAANGLAAQWPDRTALPIPLPPFEGKIGEISAVGHYEARSAGLGDSFIRAVSRATNSLVESPEIGRHFGKRLRRTLVSGFPYGLLYKAESDRIFVVAVAHLSRRPGYWRARV